VKHPSWISEVQECVEQAWQECDQQDAINEPEQSVIAAMLCFWLWNSAKHEAG